MGEKTSYKLSRLAEIAQLYYEEHRTQAEIASLFGLSRVRITRLLQDAKELGVVEINIHYMMDRHYEMERQLSDRFPLTNVWVLNNRHIARKGTSHYRENVSLALHELAASYLRSMIKKDILLGISWGNDISGTAQSLCPCEPVDYRLVQLSGSATFSNPQFSAQSIMSLLSTKTGGTEHFLNIPFLVTNAESRRTLMQDRWNSQTLKMQIFCDAALFEVSPMEHCTAEPNWLGYMDDAYFKNACANGAIGLICGRFFDIEGKEVNCRWNESAVGISLKNFKYIKEKVCVCADPACADILREALKLGFVDTLIVDGSTAPRILGYPKKA